MPRDCTVNLPRRCFTLPHAHQSSSEDHASRLHRQSSNSLSHTGSCSSKLAVERGPCVESAPSIFHFAVSHWPTLIKARSRARTNASRLHRQSSTSLSHTGLCSSKPAVERGPCVETAPSLILHCQPVSAPVSSLRNFSNVGPSMFFLPPYPQSHFVFW